MRSLMDREILVIPILRSDAGLVPREAPLRLWKETPLMSHQVAAGSD
jgi:hypothetical protein